MSAAKAHKVVYNLWVKPNLEKHIVKYTLGRLQTSISEEKNKQKYI